MQNTRYLVSRLGYRISEAETPHILCSAIAELQEDFEHSLSIVKGKDGTLFIWPERRLSPDGQRYLDASITYHFGTRVEVFAVRPDLI
jgi:hypothetical protein